MEPQIQEPIFEIETLQDWQLDAGAGEQVAGGGGSNNCSNDQIDVD